MPESTASGPGTEWQTGKTEQQITVKEKREKRDGADKQAGGLWLKRQSINSLPPFSFRFGNLAPPPS